MGENILTGLTKCFSNPPSAYTAPGFQFGVTELSQTFEEGQALCQQLDGGNAASIHSEEENEEILALIANDGRPTSLGFWIGLKDLLGNVNVETPDIERFTWVDGSARDFGTLANVSPWLSGEPNNEFGEEDCVHFVTFEEGPIGWNDDFCNVAMPMICRFDCTPPTPSPSLSPSKALSSAPTNSPSTFIPAETNIQEDWMLIIAVIGSSVAILVLMIAFSAMIRRRSNKEKKLDQMIYNMAETARQGGITGKHLSGIRAPNTRKSNRFMSIAYSVPRFSMKSASTTTTVDRTFELKRQSMETVNTTAATIHATPAGRSPQKFRRSPIPNQFQPSSSNPKYNYRF